MPLHVILHDVAPLGGEGAVECGADELVVLQLYGRRCRRKGGELQGEKGAGGDGLRDWQRTEGIHTMGVARRM